MFYKKKRDNNQYCQQENANCMKYHVLQGDVTSPRCFCYIDDSINGFSQDYRYILL